jgi:hypothetical protein
VKTIVGKTVLYTKQITPAVGGRIEVHAALVVKQHPLCVNLVAFDGDGASYFVRGAVRSPGPPGELASVGCWSPTENS